MRQLPQIKNFLRTPEERFQNLPDFPYQPHYTEIGGLRIAYIDEGRKMAPLFCSCTASLHGLFFTAK